MKNKNISKILGVLIIILFMMALIIKELYIKGGIIILFSICLWIDAKADPNTMVSTMSRLGLFWGSDSKKTIAISVSVLVVIYWVLLFLGVITERG